MRRILVTCFVALALVGLAFTSSCIIRTRPTHHRHQHVTQKQHGKHHKHKKHAKKHGRDHR